MNSQVAGFFAAMNEECLTHEPIYPRQIDELVEKIRTKLLGVSPGYQTVSLYDADWQMILTALRDLKEGLP